MKQVLLIDDNENVHRAIRKMLERSQFELSNAYDGYSGLRLMKSKKLDLLLLDWSMPGMDGGEVLEWMNDEDIRVPVILLTAQEAEELPDNIYELGVRNHLNKFSVNRNILLNEMNQTLSDNRKTVLIIDDDPIVQDKLAHDVLDDMNLKSLRASRGDIGVSMMQKHKPDLVILDYMLPDMSGLHVIDLMNKKNIKIPIILTTVDKTNAITIAFFKQDVVDYIGKPIRVPEAIGAVRKGLREHKYQQHVTGLRSGLKRSKEEILELKNFLNTLYHFQSTLSRSNFTAHTLIQLATKIPVKNPRICEEICVVEIKGNSLEVHMRTRTANSLVRKEEVLDLYKRSTDRRTHNKRSYQFDYDNINIVAIPLTVQDVSIGMQLALTKLDQIENMHTNRLALLELIAFSLAQGLYITNSQH